MPLDLESLVAQTILAGAIQLAAAHPHRCWLWVIAAASHDFLHHHYVGPCLSPMTAELVPVANDNPLRWN